MNTIQVNARVEIDRERPVLRYLPHKTKEDLPLLELHPLLAVVLDRLDTGWPAERVTDYLRARLAGTREDLHEIVTDAEVCFESHLQRRNGTPFAALGNGTREKFLDELAATATPYRTRDVVFPNDRALFPLNIQWLVTRYCNRNCIYCYAGAILSPKAKDADLPAKRIREILEEAARLGTTTFMLTGGEPLLREDSYDFVVYALELGMEPSILTKQFIPEAAVERMAAAGLKQITMSVDSLEPEVAKRMTGVRTYAYSITETIKKLVRSGIKVGVNCVLTTENLDEIPATLDKLEALGVQAVQIERYYPNLERYSERLVPAAAQIDQVREWIRKFDPGKGRAMNILLSHDNQRNPKEDGLGEDHIICANGIMTLLFLPDGRVSRCDKRLPGGTEFIVGDLTRQSVHEVWNSPEMIRSLKPPRELYEKTPCYDCGHFDTCHERGRCFYNAYLTSGTLFGPDASCPFTDSANLAGC